MDHGHAVALTPETELLREHGTAAAQQVLPLTDADLKRYSGVSVGFTNSLLCIMARKAQAALCVDGGRKRARKTTIKRERKLKAATRH
jgi:hypothetical protein